MAWDSYENGNYDVFLQRFQRGQAEAGDSRGHHVRLSKPGPSLAVDRQDRVWIGYEQGGPNWGKDFGQMVPVASSAGRAAEIAAAAAHVRPGDGPAGDRRRRRGHSALRSPAGGGEVLRRGPAAAAGRRSGDVPGASCRGPRASPAWRWPATGGCGCSSAIIPCPAARGETWAEYAMSYDGQAWGKPRMLADSDNLLDNRPAVVPFGADGVLAVYSSDWRLRGAINSDGEGNAAAEERSCTRRCCAAAARWRPPQLAADEPAAAAVEPVHPHEPQDIQRLREVRVESAGKTYQLARGEFHRHTEYTAHRDGDGSLEDMWRYSQDAADMDWMGNADHDNGFGQQYAWWTIQKTTDIYHNPPWFVAPFTYERSVNYPNGHRNVIFAQRGIRTLPRGDMDGRRADAARPTPRCSMPICKHFGGICASHTSATGMGTDWRDNDPLVEPVVEIYQGDRNNYECEGRPAALPRGRLPASDRERRAVHPKGFVWNALAKGYRFGFESSSDHISTHSSYGVALVEAARPRGAAGGLPARRCYAATDNILLMVQLRRAPDGRGVRRRPASRRWRSTPWAPGRSPSSTSSATTTTSTARRPTRPASTCNGPTPIRPPAAGGLLLRPHPAGRHQPGLELADVDPPRSETLKVRFLSTDEGNHVKRP